jgi:staphylococcal nuclease domain-containing protein 1
MVRAVQSGDCLTLAKTAGKDPFEEQCYLAFVSAPRCGNNNRSEEPFAFDAREFVREKIIGRKVDFTIEY